MMVFYYASWCGGCTAIKPHYVAASEEAFDHADINCTFVAVDCEHNPNTCASTHLGHPSSNCHPLPMTPNKAFISKKWGGFFLSCAWVFNSLFGDLGFLFDHIR